MGLFNETKVARLVKVFEAKGRIYLVRQGFRRYIRLFFYSANYNELQDIQVLIGGQLSLTNRTRIYQLQVARRNDLLRLFKLVLPLLDNDKVKERTLLALAWCESTSMTREAFADKFKALTHPYPSP